MAKTNNFLGWLSVSSVFSETKKGKSKETFENKGRIVGFRGCVPCWLLGLVSGPLGSAGGLPLRVAHYPTKSAYFANLGAIAFLHPSQISVLRAF